MGGPELDFERFGDDFRNPFGKLFGPDGLASMFFRAYFLVTLCTNVLIESLIGQLGVCMEGMAKTMFTQDRF